MLNVNLTKELNDSSSSSSPSLNRPWDVWEILLLFMLLFGAIGNILTIIVMRSKHMRQTNESLIITFISTSDIGLLLIKFIVNMQKMYKLKIYNLCILIHFILPQALAWLIHWLIVILIMQRCIAVLKPMQVNILFSKKRCRIIMFSMITFFIALSCTQAFCLEYNKKSPQFCVLKYTQIKILISNNSTKKISTFSTDDMCGLYMNVVFLWLKISLMSFAPCTLSTIFNIIMIKSLIKSNRFRRKHSSLFFKETPSINKKNSLILIEQQQPKKQQLIYKQAKSIVKQQDELGNNINIKLKSISHDYVNTLEKNERQITITLFLISVTFILFTMPFTIYEIIRKTESLYLKYKHILKYRHLHRFVHFLLDCLHSTNFILFCLVGERFRKQLKLILCKNVNKSNNNKFFLSNKFESTSFNNCNNNHNELHDNINKYSHNNNNKSLQKIDKYTVYI